MRIGINGACGRMGTRLLALAGDDPSWEIAAALEHPNHPDLGRDAGLAAGLGEIGVTLAAELPAEVEVLVDFSAPEATMVRLAECRREGVPMVVGTTGLSEAQQAELAAAEIPVLLSANMSLGVNLLREIAPSVAQALGDDFDIEIVESHHRFKKDAPSGTALMLGRAIAEALGRDLKAEAVHGREGAVGERPRREIGFHAIRAGDIVGEHTVVFGGLGERIELRHVAHSRDTFARGALRAARFLVSQPPGLYSMKDVLGL